MNSSDSHPISAIGIDVDVDLESRGRPAERNGFSSVSGNSTKERRYSHSRLPQKPRVDWDEYEYCQTGNKASSVWLFCLFAMVGLLVQQASLSINVAKTATIRSELEHNSGAFSSSPLALSSPAVDVAVSRKGTMMDVSENRAGVLTP